MKLTEKQERWIDYYVETGNATEAARLAGYRGKNPDVIGCENLRKLSSEVKARMNAKKDERIAKQDEVLQFITSVMRGEITEEVIVSESVSGVGSSPICMDKHVGAKDRLKAAEMLAKRYGLLTEKVDVTMNETGVVLLPDAEAVEE